MNFKAFLTEASGVWVLIVDNEQESLTASDALDKIETFSSETSLVKRMLNLMDRDISIADIDTTKIKTLKQVRDLITNSDELSIYNDVFYTKQVAMK